MLTLARYNADGSIDTSFGNSGRITDAIVEVGRAAALDAEGRIVAAGRVSGDFGIVRLDPNGVLDTSFGDNGLLTVDFFGGADTPNAIAIQPDGRIIVAGAARNGTSDVLGIVRIVP